MLWLKQQRVVLLQEEETTVLPRLATMLSAEAQLQLGIQFEASKVGCFSWRLSTPLKAVTEHSGKALIGLG